MSEEKPEKTKKINLEQVKARLQHLKVVQSMVEDLPELIIESRQDAKITQLELGEALGVDVQQVSRDEGQDYQNAALHKLRRILNATIKLIEQELNQ
jgi:ribosome-binding protein aMBF1 (putative translation factor)